ncbi:sigma-70 family RNA polymerase sigma factor [Clostridium sp. OF03-18AA]|nr:sigma-70 family RNA polymerase sigma factor [Clostridium sp. OF03-18AA]
MSISDIAEKQGITCESVKVQLHRIKKRVKIQVLNFE